MYYGDSTISVNVKGSTETEFTSATFNASVTGYGKTGPEAKEKVFPVIEKLKKTILSHAEPAGIDTTRLKTTFDVLVDNDRATGAFVGYKAVYTIKFTGKNVTAAPAVHDALTSIESVQAQTPVYNLDDSAEVHGRAFNDAAAKAKTKFIYQCKALNLDPNHYVVKSWSIIDEEPRGKTLSFSEGAAAKPIGLEPGKASLDIRVTINYASDKPKAN